MRNYAIVTPQFWIGETGKKMRGHQEAQIISFYLMSNPHSNMIGLYHLPKIYISHDTGLPLEGACKGLLRAVEVGFCDYDDVSEVVWVYEMAKYQISQNGSPLKEKDKRCIGVQNDYNNIPNNRFLVDFYNKYCDIFHMTSIRNYIQIASPFEAPYKPPRSQEQEQEQEQEQNKNKINTCAKQKKIKLTNNEDFERFYKLYPKKLAKANAEKAWLKNNPPIDLVLTALAWQMKSEDWIKDDGKFIPHPATWINAKRWLDEPTKPIHKTDAYSLSQRRVLG